MPRLSLCEKRGCFDFYNAVIKKFQAWASSLRFEYQSFVIHSPNLANTLLKGSRLGLLSGLRIGVNVSVQRLSARDYIWHYIKPA